MKILITSILCFSTYFVTAQSLNTNWQNELQSDLSEFKSCNNAASNGINPCNRFMGLSLKTVYSINDFYNKDSDRYMLVNEMAEYLEKSTQWKEMGAPYDQKVLNQAQQKANQGIPVVALYMDQNGLGHMSLIIPGEMHSSVTWSLKVPNASSFFTVKPHDSFVGKGLSYAFMRSQLMRVKLYSRG